MIMKIANPQEKEWTFSCDISKLRLSLIRFFILDELKEFVRQYFDRVLMCEGQKWDLEHEVKKRDYEVIVLFNLNSQTKHYLLLFPLRVTCVNICSALAQSYIVH